MHEKSPKENFPYLFDPNYSYSEKDKKKWTALTLNKKDDGREKVLGYVFIHLFRGIFVKRIIKKKKRGRRSPIKEETKPQEVLFFIFIGNRSYMEYLKTRIQLISVIYPRSLIVTEHQF